MRALRNVHTVLVIGGLVIDTQPVSPHPPVEADTGEIGALDMSEWARTIDEIDEQTDETLRAGLFTIVDEQRFVVTDHFDDGAELVTEAGGWVGTRIDPGLAERIVGEHGRVRLHQEVRLRVLRTCPDETFPG